MLTPEREKEIRSRIELGYTDRYIAAALLAEIDRLRAVNEVHCKMWNEAEDEIKKLREHKQLLWEENGQLLKEKESGQWDKNCTENAQLREKLDVAVEALKKTENRFRGCDGVEGNSWIECREALNKIRDVK